MKILALIAVLCLTARAMADDAQLDEQASSLKFTGHAFLHDFHGEAKDFHGVAQIDPGAPVLVRSALLKIMAGKMTTFEDARDQNMETWLHVTANPVILFELTKVIPLTGDLAHATKEHPAQFTVSGTFTLNKVGKPLETTASAWRDGTNLVVEGTAQIDTSDHGLPVVRTLFLTVDKKVDIAFHLVFEVQR
jgi:polyisoprenoid-binding protein YceI